MAGTKMSLLERMYRELWHEHQRLKDQVRALEKALEQQDEELLANELMEMLEQARIPPDRVLGWLSLEVH